MLSVQRARAASNIGMGRDRATTPCHIDILSGAVDLYFFVHWNGNLKGLFHQWAWTQMSEPRAEVVLDIAPNF